MSKLSPQRVPGVLELEFGGELKMYLEFFTIFFAVMFVCGIAGVGIGLIAVKIEQWVCNKCQEGDI